MATRGVAGALADRRPRGKAVVASAQMPAGAVGMMSPSTTMIAGFAAGVTVAGHRAATRD